jgi:hypothetical protein
LPDLNRGERVQIFKARSRLSRPLLRDTAEFHDTVEVLSGDDTTGLEIAEKGDFGFNIGGEMFFRAAQQDIRLNTDTSEFFDAVLGRFGFDLAGRFNIGYQGQMNIADILFADISLKLPDGLQERQTFDIAHGPADFDNGDINLIIVCISSVMWE